MDYESQGSLSTESDGVISQLPASGKLSIMDIRASHKYSCWLSAWLSIKGE